METLRDDHALNTSVFLTGLLQPVVARPSAARKFGKSVTAPATPLRCLIHCWVIVCFVGTGLTETLHSLGKSAEYSSSERLQ